MRPLARNLVLTIGIALVAGACRRDAPPLRSNIVLIVMDTVRADRLSCYGYPRPTTPGVDAFAADAIRFENAYASSSWTLPSHASLFTGLPPHTHRANQRHWRLDERFVTLAEILAAGGYATAAFSENPWVARRTGLAQGFQTMAEVWTSTDAGVGASPSTNRAIADWLGDRDRSRPFFLFVNYIEAHYPYEAPEPYRSRFLHRAPDAAELREASIRWTDWYLNGRSIRPSALAVRSDLYDAELARVDAGIADLLALLASDDTYAGSLIVVTSDHGENLGERGHLDHVFSLYNSTLRVPLLMKLPNTERAGTVRSDPVQLTDVFTTIVNLAGLEPAAGSIGNDLLGTTMPATRPIVAEYDHPLQALEVFAPAQRGSPAIEPFQRDLRSIQVGRRKLIWGSDGRHELYELDDGFRERAEILSASPDLASAMADQLRALVAADAPATQQSTDGPAIDPAAAERLRALGYLP